MSEPVGQEQEGLREGLQDRQQEQEPEGRRRRERKAMLLRLDPEVHDALARWAADDLRSTNGHVEWLLRKALLEAGRLKER